MPPHFLDPMQIEQGDPTERGVARPGMPHSVMRDHTPARTPTAFPLLEGHTPAPDANWSERIVEAIVLPESEPGP